MARYRERRVRLSSSSPTFDVFPLLALPMLYFNFMVFVVIGLNQAAVNAWLSGPAFQLTMFSGAVWAMTQADVVVAAGMGLLFIEVLKSVGSPMLSLVNPGDNRHQFNRCYVQLPEMGDDRGVGQCGHGAAQCLWNIGMQQGETAHVQLIDQAAGQIAQRLERTIGEGG